MGDNLNQDLVNINAYTNLVKFYQFVLKILSVKENLTSMKGHNSVKKSRKITGNIPNLDLVIFHKFVTELKSLIDVFTAWKSATAGL